MTSTMIATPDLAKGVPYSELTRIVAEAHPSLIAAMEKASEEFYRHDAIWQEEVARNQRNAGLPERSLESPFGKALREVLDGRAREIQGTARGRGGDPAHHWNR